MLIAILEDDPDVGAITKKWLEDADHRVTLFASSAQLLDHASLQEFDVFLLDWMLPDITGLEVLKLLKLQPQIVAPILFVTIRDAETGEQLLVDTADGGFRKRFARIAAQREADLQQGFVQAGVDVLELSTDDDLVQALTRFTDLRKSRSRMAAGSVSKGLAAHLKRAA